MKYFPRPDRGPVRLDGLTVSRAPWHASRLTRILAALVIFTAGFFTGAIAFGEILIRSIPSAPSASSVLKPNPGGAR